MVAVYICVFLFTLNILCPLIYYYIPDTAYILYLYTTNIYLCGIYLPVFI